MIYNLGKAGLPMIMLSRFIRLYVISNVAQVSHQCDKSKVVTRHTFPYMEASNKNSLGNNLSRTGLHGLFHMTTFGKECKFTFNNTTTIVYYKHQSPQNS